MIDLTKMFHQEILVNNLILIRSSVLKNIKVSDLNKAIAIKTIPGATIDKLTDTLNELSF